MRAGCESRAIASGTPWGAFGAERCSVWAVKWLNKRDVQIYLALGVVEVVIGLTGVFIHRHGGSSTWSWLIIALGVLYIGRAVVGDRRRRRVSVSGPAPYAARMTSPPKRDEKES